MHFQTKEASPIMHFVPNYKCEFCYMSHNSNFLKLDVCYGQFLSKLSLMIQLLDYTVALYSYETLIMRT